MDEKIKSFVIRAVGVLLILLFSYFIIVYGLPAAVPFAIAYAVSCLIRPAGSFLEKKTGIKSKIWSVILILIAVGAVSLTVFFLTRAFLREAKELLLVIKDGIAKNDSPVRQASDRIMGFMREINAGDGISVDLKDVLSGAFTRLTSFLADLVAKIVAKAPSFVLFVVVLVLSLFYFSCDTERIKNEIGALIPKRVFLHIVRATDLAKRAGIRFLRAYLSLFGITFAILTVGFFLIGVDYPLLAAIFCAIVDIMPVLGVGTVLVPWSVLLFITGEGSTAVGMMVLFLVLYIVRQVLEPRIVGSAAGVHPLLALFAVFLGYRLFGVGGMILAPVLLNGARVFWEEKKKKSAP